MIGEPLSVLETFLIIIWEKVCYDLRYYVVLFQTHLNGNNNIIDNTDPKVGKISHLLCTIPDSESYIGR